MSEWAEQLDEAERLAAEGNANAAFLRAFGALEACYASAAGLSGPGFISFAKSYEALKAANRITGDEYDQAKHLANARNCNAHKYGFEPSDTEAHRCVHRIRRLCGKFAKTVHDVMIKPVVTALVTDPIGKFVAIMDEKGLSNIPVVDSVEITIATLDEGTIINAILASNGSLDLARPVSDLAIRPALPDILPSASLEQAARMLRERNAAALLVLAEGRPSGIVTAYDLIH